MDSVESLLGKLVSECVTGEFPGVLAVTGECYLMAFSFDSVSTVSPTVIIKRIPEWCLQTQSI